MVEGQPWRPLVYVAAFDPDTVRFLLTIGARTVVWWFEGGDRLTECVQRFLSSDAVELLRRMHDGVDALGPLVRAGMRRICTLRLPPIVRVQQLAAAVGASSTTLRSAWGADFPSWRPKRSIDCALLLKALDLASVGKGKVDIAYELGVHESTLERLCQRMTGMRWARNASARDIRDAVSRVEREWRDAMLSARRSGATAGSVPPSRLTG